MITATYDPHDDKLRLTSSSRLDAETYALVRAAGFRWAPRQEQFVAPCWTPAREDLALELAGEIGDEDTTLAERASDRSERFEGYSERRAAEAESAHAAVARIADGIPLGQPLLVSHHSYKRALKDAERIESGMRKAVRLWDTSSYWVGRAAASKAHARHHELPAVRHRRIRELEADRRKQEKIATEHEERARAWAAEGLTLERAVGIANMDHVSVTLPGEKYSTSLWSLLTDGRMGVEAAVDEAVRLHVRAGLAARRWLGHIECRLAYEREMLGEQGGIAASGFDLQVGGRVLVRGEWSVVTRLNRVDGEVASVSTSARYVRVKGVEEIQDYRAPAEGDAERVATVTKLAPLTNYRADGCLEMTAAEWKKKPRDFAVVRRVAATEEHGAHRRREYMRGFTGMAPVFLTDARVVERPALVPAAGYGLPPTPPDSPRRYRVERPDPAAGLRASLAGGVTVVVAPQLFPTPAALAVRMAQLLGVNPGDLVLEPSAGTGVLVEAALAAASGVRVVAVERAPALHEALVSRFRGRLVVAHQGDFLEMADLGQFARILMNPPFERGADIRHVDHALGFLHPGGRLVALVADGPRQREAYERWSPDLKRGLYEPLPAGTFAAQGTGVRVALVVVEG